MPRAKKPTPKAEAAILMPQLTAPLDTIAREVGLAVARQISDMPPPKLKAHPSDRASADEAAQRTEDRIAELVSKALVSSLASRSAAATALRTALISQMASTEMSDAAAVASRPTDAESEAMLTTFQAAARLEVSHPTVQQLCNQGKLGKIFKTEGGHRRIPASAVEAYKATRMTRL